MSPVMIAGEICAGAAAGGLMTWLYFRLLRRQVDRFAREGSASGFAALGYLLRLVLIGGVMGLLLWWSLWSAIAYAVVFLVGRGWKLHQYAAASRQDNVEP